MSFLYSEELIFFPWFTRYHQKMSCRRGLTPVAAQEREFCSGAKSCKRGTASPWTGTNTACRSFRQFSRDFSHYVVLRRSVQRNVLKSVMRVQSCFFPQKTNWFQSPSPHCTPPDAHTMHSPVSLYLLLSSWIICS